MNAYVSPRMEVASVIEIDQAGGIKLAKVSYTVDEFCAAYGVSRSYLYGEISSGRLKTKKAGRRTLIRTVDAQAWLDSLPDGSS